MKHIRILGGLSAESTACYYPTITQEYVRQYRNFTYPEILICNIDFQQFLDCQNAGQWGLITEWIDDISYMLAQAGV